MVNNHLDFLFLLSLLSEFRDKCVPHIFCVVFVIKYRTLYTLGKYCNKRTTYQYPSNPRFTRQMSQVRWCFCFCETNLITSVILSDLLQIFRPGHVCIHVLTDQTLFKSCSRVFLLCCGS